MEEKLENKIKELCYKIENIYNERLIKIIKDEQIMSAIRIIFFGIETGVVRKVADYLSQKESTEEEFSTFVSELIKQAKSDTKQMINHLLSKEPQLEKTINEVYDEITSAIIEKREGLLDTMQVVPVEEVALAYEDTNEPEHKDDEQAISLGTDGYVVLKDKEGLYELMVGGVGLGVKDLKILTKKIIEENPELKDVKMRKHIAPDNGIVNITEKEVIISGTDQSIQDSYDRAHGKKTVDAVNTPFDENEPEPEPEPEDVKEEVQDSTSTQEQEDNDEKIDQIEENAGLDEEEKRLLKEAVEYDYNLSDREESEETTQDLVDFTDVESQELTEEGRQALIEELSKELDFDGDEIEEMPKTSGRRI